MRKNINVTTDLKYISNQVPLSFGIYLKSQHENLMRSEYYKYMNENDSDDVIINFITKLKELEAKILAIPRIPLDESTVPDF